MQQQEQVPESMDFTDIAPKEIPTKIGSRQLVLREASEGAAVQFRNASLRAARMSEGEVVGMDGLASAEPLLVSLCLWETKEADGGFVADLSKPVTLAYVNNLPSRIVKKLYNTIVSISDLREEADSVDTVKKRIEKDRKLLARLEGKLPKDETENSPLDTPTISS